MPTRNRRRARHILIATCALGVGIVSAQTATSPPQAEARTHVFTNAANVAKAGATNRQRRPRPTASPSSSPTPDPTTSSPPEPTASPAPSSADPTTAAASTSASTATPTTTVIDQVLAHINAARTANSLQPFTLSAELSQAAAAHTELMVNGCGLSHQCPGEASLGDRFTAAGVSWTSGGENIGYSSAGSSDAEIAEAANGVTDSMLAEVAPNDGHRRNLLNAGFTRIGLAVVRDANGRVWMTQDFVN